MADHEALYDRLTAENNRLRDVLVWAVEWMDEWGDGEVMPGWREWTERARLALYPEHSVKLTEETDQES